MQTDSATGLTQGGGAGGAGGAAPAGAGGAGTPQNPDAGGAGNGNANPDPAALVEQLAKERAERERLTAHLDKILGEKKEADEKARLAREAEKRKAEEEGNLKSALELTQKELDEFRAKATEGETTATQLRTVTAENEAYRKLAAESVAERVKGLDEATVGKLKVLHPEWDKLSPLEQLPALDRFLAVVGQPTQPKGRTSPGVGVAAGAAGTAQQAIKQGDVKSLLAAIGT